MFLVEWVERDRDTEETESGLRDGLPNETLFLFFQSHEFKRVLNFGQSHSSQQNQRTSMNA
jgi:hypothetical protein